MSFLFEPFIAGAFAAILLFLAAALAITGLVRRHRAALRTEHDRSEFAAEQLRLARNQAETNAGMLQTALHAIPDGILITNPDGIVSSCNPAAVRLLRLDEHLATGQPHQTIFRLADEFSDEPPPSLIDSALRGIPASGSALLRAADGNCRRITLSASPFGSDENGRCGSITIFRAADDDDNRHSRHHKTATLLEYCAEMTASAAFRFDPPTRRITGTNLLSDLWPQQDGVALEHVYWVFSDDFAQFDHAIHRMAEESEPVTVHFRSNYYGELRHYRLKGSCDRTNPARPEITGVIQNVTEITRSTGKLRETVGLWNLVMDAIPVAIYAKSVNDNYRYTLVNKAFCDFVGKPGEEIVGRTDMELFPNPDEAAAFEHHDRAIIRSGVPGELIETPIDGHGNRRNFHTLKMPFRNAEGEQLLLGVSTDVTELNNLIESEHIVNEALSQIALEPVCARNLPNILEILVAQTHADCAAVIQFASDSGHTVCIGEHLSDRHIHSMHTMPPEALTQLLEACRADINAGRPIRISCSEDNPATIPWLRLGVRFVSGAPVREEGELRGAILCGFVEHHRPITNIDDRIMNSMANLTALALIREKQALALQRADTEKALILNNIRIPIWLHGKDGSLLRANTAAEALPPDSGEAVLREAVAAGRHAQREVRVGERDYLMEAQPVFEGAGGALLSIVRSAVDITELNAFGENERVLNACLESFFGTDDMAANLPLVLEKIARHMKADRCFVLKFDLVAARVADYQEFAEEATPPFAPAVEEWTFRPDEPWLETFRKGEPVICRTPECIQNTAVTGSWSRYGAETGSRSLYVAGIQAGGKLWGNLGLAFIRRNCDFGARELNFLRAAAHLVGLVIERNQARRKLLDALEQARAGEKAKSFFIASVSHELRTPLNAIIGFSELLHDTEIDRKTEKEYLHSIAYSGNTLLQLINDVLDLSKLEAGQMVLEPEFLDFAKLGNEVLKLFLPRARGTGVALRLITDNLPDLALDRHKLRQILFNLIGNAVKFTTSGSVTLDGEFTARTDSTGTFRFSVADTGPGICAEDREKLMQPFVQLTGLRGTNANNNGTGLGLAISRKLVENMGGTIVIESAPGQGTVFRVELPGIAFHRLGKAPGDGTTQVQKPTDATDFSNMTVLTVDDVAINCKVLAAMCRKLGVGKVECAGNGCAALAVLESMAAAGRVPDLVLTDLWMPEMDGAELARRIRADRRFDDMPIAAVTADVEAQAAFRESGFDDFLLKPVTGEQLGSLLRRLHQEA